jgi:beta-hydroxylase
LGRPGRRQPPRTAREWILRLGKDARPFVNRIIARYSRVGVPPVFEPARFPWIREMEAHWRVVRKEAEQLLEHRQRLPELPDLSPDHANIAQGPGWKSYILYGYGYRRERACQRCPETARLLERVPGLVTAFFSIMEPGKYIKRHRGPTQAILTWHIPLRVPDHYQDCQILIDGVPYAWEEGKSLIFDDTFPHEVWNMTDQERVVLLMHIRRPVRFPGSLVTRFMLRAIKMSPFIQDARKNQERWEADFEASLRDAPGPLSGS